MTVFEKAVAEVRLGQVLQRGVNLLQNFSTRSAPVATTEPVGGN
jgi:hypothetical protein